MGTINLVEIKLISSDVMYFLIFLEVPQVFIIFMNESSHDSIWYERPNLLRKHTTYLFGVDLIRTSNTIFLRRTEKHPKIWHLWHIFIVLFVTLEMLGFMF